MNPDTVASFHDSMQRCCTLLSLYRECVCTHTCMWVRLFLGWAERSVTEIAVRRVSPFPTCPPGCSGSRIQHAGFGDRCDQVFVLSVPPSPPTDFRLTAACYHNAILLVPETNTKIMRRHNTDQKLENGVKWKHFLYITDKQRLRAVIFFEARVTKY